MPDVVRQHVTFTQTSTQLFISLGGVNIDGLFTGRIFFNCKNQRDCQVNTSYITLKYNFYLLK